MKRVIAAALCALLLLSLCPIAFAEEDTVPGAIASRADMELLCKDPTGVFELTDDIDMGGEAWTPISFSGKLNGHGHTLYNLTVTAPGPDTATTFDGNYKEYETVFGGLFSVLKGAEIRELNLTGAVVDIHTDRHCFLGGLAGYAEHSVISGCAVQTRNHLTLTSVNAGVAGLVGFSVENEFTDCTVDAELTFTDINRDQLCEEFLGGVYAAGSGHIDGCAVRTRGFAEVFGYAHSGGIIGMYKAVKDSKYRSHVNDTTADTEISFFEKTKSRRAYCSPTIGEDLKRECGRKNMIVAHYARHEYQTPKRLSPEECETPQYTSVVSPGACSAWGFVTHTCAVCGYSFRDGYTPPVHQYAAAESTPPTCTEAGSQTYRCTLCGHSYSEPIPPAGHLYQQTVTAPTCTEAGERVFVCARCGDRYVEPLEATGHTPGDWETTKAPQVNAAGEELQACRVCGAVLQTREIPALPYVAVEKVVLSADALSLNVGQESRLSASLFPADATDHGCTFTSSDASVAKVLPDGSIQAISPGTATITCASADGQAQALCTVTVTFTAWQWVKRYVLFGWIWE